jgi:hypothetical protein
MTTDLRAEAADEQRPAPIVARDRERSASPPAKIAKSTFDDDNVPTDPSTSLAAIA